MARVLFLDPYHGPSHSALSRSLRDRSRHDVTLLALPARKWKWRMRGAAFAFEHGIRALPEPPDILVSTDMLNLPDLLGLVRDRLPPILPVITCFHENQITYPLPSRDERDFHFALVNIYSALASDLVVFNSAFHRDEFLDAVEDVLRQMPDHRPHGVPDRIRRRCEVIGVSIDIPAEIAAAADASRMDREPLVLWNHRWEEDKDPETFFRVMRLLARRGVKFGLAVLGESFREVPACFDEAARDLRDRICHWGFLPSRDDYLTAVSRCRVVVSTARHEFYGLAVREAVRLGCRPLLPRRVVYPDLVGGREEFLYDTEEDLADRLESILTGPPAPPPPDLVDAMAADSVDRIVARWDALFDPMA